MYYLEYAPSSDCQILINIVPYQAGASGIKRYWLCSSEKRIVDLIRELLTRQKDGLEPTSLLRLRVKRICMWIE